MTYYLAGTTVFIAILTIVLSPKAKTLTSFFSGESSQGKQAGLITLIFSQVTTWIFARSLLNAAILGFYYGIWGTLAYAAYYLSFITGAGIVDSIRFRHGYNNIQNFLTDRFGKAGHRCYNLVIGLRLISEVFANLLVIGILFGTQGTSLYTLSILGFSGVTLIYSVIGGLHASLRTDLMQMVVFLIVLAVLLVSVISGDNFNWDVLGFVAFDIKSPGPILLIVALLQVWSYPMHDPVMMDRGFISDRRTTKLSFYHAAWISFLCIMAFGLLGIYAGANAISGEDMNQALERLTNPYVMFMMSITLIISAMSTLDSTLSSAAKLIVKDMQLFKLTLLNGRLVMLAFMLMGLLLVFTGSQDLFSAVAVSGTASMYLAPVIFFCVWGNKQHIATWSYLGSFVLAVGGALLYFTESSGYTQLLGTSHKYTKLLWICITVLIGGCSLFWMGIQKPELHNTLSGQGDKVS